MPRNSPVKVCKKISLALPVFLFLFLSGSPAQEIVLTAQNFHQWGSVTLFNGLPSDSVRAIAQTPDGVMWFGTDNGLARFDGRRIQTFPFAGPDANQILALQLAQDGSLWIGTRNGAVRYTDGRFEKIEGTEGLPVTAIMLGEGTMLATENGFIQRVAPTENGTLHAERTEAEALTAGDGSPLRLGSLADFGGRLIAGTGGRSLMTVENGHASEIQMSPRPYFVNSLTPDGRGAIWLGAGSVRDGGVYFINDIGKPEKISEIDGQVLTTASDGQRGVWAGTFRDGLYHYGGPGRVEHFTFDSTSGSLRSNTVLSVFVDREGVIWAGTNRGVSRYDASSPFQEVLSPDSPNGNFVRTLYRQKDGHIIAGTNRGLFTFDGQTWTESPAFAQKTIFAVSEDPSGAMVVGSLNGLLDASGKINLPGEIRAIANFRGKQYAAVYGRGVLEFAGDSQNVVFQDDSPTSLFAAADKLYIGTATHGLFSFNGTAAVHETAFDGVNLGAIWKVVPTDDGLWLACSRGLFRSKNGSPTETIIADHEVRDVFIDHDDVWAATVNDGFVHARRDPQFGWLLAPINAEQGLPSEKTFAVMKDGERFLIASNRGIVAYAPGSVAPTIIPTRILSQRLHDPSEIRSTIALDYPQNSILTEVAGQSSRTFPEEFQYAYSLKDSNGKVLDQRISRDAQYSPTDLKPGTYSIEARAFNRDLLASEALKITFSVAKAPFPWTATALGILLAIALIALVWVVIERRRIAERNRQLAAARFDLANEAERERRRIARDLHDQTLADLRNLMIMSDRLAPDNAEFRSEVESVSTEVRRICEDLSPSLLENVGLVAALEFLLTHTVKNHQFSSDEHLEDRLKFPPNIQIQIYRIAQEVLTNIERHSDAKLVKMDLQSADGEFLLTISDDGNEFHPGQKGKGRGISNIRSRAALINANADWHTRNGHGTTFTLSKQLDQPT